MIHERQRPRPAWMDKPRTPPWIPPTYLSEDVAALKAVWAGEATPGQQRLALEWIIAHAAQYGELSFRSGDPHETSFAQGRWFVGQQIQKLIGLDARLIAKLREQENAGPRTATTADATHARAGQPLIDPDKHARSGS